MRIINMKKIYMLFLVFILAGCTDSNDIEPKSPNGEYDSIDHIVEDVALGQRDYIGRTVKINGIVERAADDFTPDPRTAKYQITIETGSSAVEFFILGDKVVPPLIEPNKPITEYKKEFPYDFYIFISEVRPDEPLPNSYRIVSYLIVDEIDIEIDTFVSNVRLNPGYKYVDNIIHLAGGAEVISGPGIIRPGEPEFYVPEKIYLKTSHNDVSFIVNDYAAPPNKLDQFKNGFNYDLVLFIQSFNENAADHSPIIRTRINSIIVWNEP